LTAEQKRELIAKLLKAKPEASNATVAKQTKADDKTVAKVRRKLESTSEIPKLEKTVGADGKERKSRFEHCVAAAPEIGIEQRRAENARLDQPSEETVSDLDRRVEFVVSAALRQVRGLPLSETERFFAALRDRIDAEREALRELRNIIAA